MKRICLFLIFLFITGITNYTFADYPIVGYRYLADPGALVHNGRVYVYCSNDDENGDNGYDMSSIVCVSSSDMKNWTDHGVVFDVPRDASWSGLSWAPSPAYKNGKFYLYFGNGGSAIGVAVSDSPTGPFVDPVGRAIVTGSTPGVQPSTNMWLFDPMTFIDDDGQAYMYFGGNGNDNLRVIRLNNNMTSVNGSAGRFTVPNFFEAAWMHKHNGVYYFSYSSNPGAGMRIEYMTSTNPMTGFTYRGVMSPQPPNNNNNNHHATVLFNGQWYQIYHNRIVASQSGVGTTYHRNLAVDVFSHRQDGTIVQMVNTVNGVKQVKYLDPYVRVEAETMSDHKGIETEVCSEGGMNLAFIDNNDWVMVEGVDFGSSGAGNFSARVASNKTGGSIEIRLGSSTGTLIGTLAVPNTGGFQTWQTVAASVSQTTGVHNVYLVFKGSSASLFNFNHWSFSSTGPMVNFTSPATGAVFEGGSSITLNATATTTSGSITDVKFYNGTTLLGSDNSSPYSFNWTNVPAGTHTVRAVATDNQGKTSTATITIVVNPPQGPYNGTAHAIPGTIQFEAYDVGGNGFAYLDNTPGSEVTPTVNFRTTEDVDIENCTDTDGGYNIGFATAGEWLEYTVNVQTAGTYHMDLRIACNGEGRTLSVSMDGTNIASNVAIPNTAGWQTWQTVRVSDIALTAGQKIMRVTIGATDYVNMNYVAFALSNNPPTVSITAPANNSTYTTLQTVTLTATASDADGSIASVAFYSGTTLLGTDNTSPYSYTWSGMSAGTHTITAKATDDKGGVTTSAPITVIIQGVQSPFNTNRHTIPGRIEAEEYDLGGEGLGYHEVNTNGNEGGATFRNDEVDIEATGDADGDYNISYILQDEWLEYSVEVQTTRKYDLDVRVASDGAGKTFHIEIDGVDASGPITVPNTGGFQTWATVSVPDIQLSEGEHQMRIVFDASYFNLNYVEFKEIITSVYGHQADGLNIYPNPFNAKGLQIKKDGEFTYRIANANGAVMSQGKAQDVKTVGEDLMPGMYILFIENNNEVSIHKIVKQ